MRFFATPSIEMGTKRKIKKFLFFPVTIKDETRFLETATILQEYEVSGAADVFFRGWVNKEFLND